MSEEVSGPVVVDETTCRAYIDVALGAIADICGSLPEKLFKDIVSKFLGVDASSMNPLSAHCKEVLVRGVTKEVAENFFESRRWVMCRAWEMMFGGEVKPTLQGFGEAVKMAWDELHAKMAELAKGG